MNMWGFTPTFFESLSLGFKKFLSELQEEDLKTEYLLPTIIGEMLENGLIEVKVLESSDKWFGVTYKEDKIEVMEAIRKLNIENR